MRDPLGTGSAAVAAPEEPAIATRAPAVVSKKVRLLEFCLVLAVAVLPLLLGAFFYAHHKQTELGTFLDYRLARLLFDEAASLGLLAYVLSRQGRCPDDIGLGFRAWDMATSVFLLLGGSFASYAAYEICLRFNFVPSAADLARTQMWISVIRGSALGMVLVCLNPFFEELIVRAYVITEVKALTGSAVLAVLASTGLQMAYHFYQGGPAAVRLGTMFLVFSIYFAITRRATPLILAHFYMDMFAIFR